MILSRMSFFWAIGMDHFMEVAKCEQVNPLGQADQTIRSKIKVDGTAHPLPNLRLGLTEQDPYNNVARTCIEAMAAVFGGTQSLHTNALDEAIALPTDFSARIARRRKFTCRKKRELPEQLILGEDLLCRTFDPRAGRKSQHPGDRRAGRNGKSQTGLPKSSRGISRSKTSKDRFQSGCYHWCECVSGE